MELKGVGALGRKRVGRDFQRLGVESLYGIKWQYHEDSGFQALLVCRLGPPTLVGHRGAEA